MTLRTDATKPGRELRAFELIAAVSTCLSDFALFFADESSFPVMKSQHRVQKFINLPL
jgi:hypothetical protein